MNKNMVIYLVLGLLFTASIVLVSLRPTDRPFSSYSSNPDGTKAAYLLLEKLGFRVSRKTSRDWKGDGVLLVMGPQYVDVQNDSLTLSDDYKFTNWYIRDNAYEFVKLMWPYRDQTIYFEEYRRAPVPIDTQGEAMSLADITPRWFQILFWNTIAGALFVMLFYRQRLGEPQPAPEFAGRAPLEGVYAMAGALQKTRLYADSLRYYYRYQCRGGNQWDVAGLLSGAAPRSEREALELMGKMDEKLEEYRHGYK